jgi:hypothetical protein
MRLRSFHFQSGKIILLLLVLNSCIIEPEFRPVMPTGNVTGYRPIYRTEPDMQVSFESARPLKKPGKIYSYHPYLLVNEQNEGIHFYLNSDPTNPEPIGFLRIGGNTDFVMKGNIVYANNYFDLLALDISNKSSIKELSRIPQPSWIQNFPPMSEHRFFECADPSKGVLIGWELTTITNPKCYR